MRKPATIADIFAKLDSKHGITTRFRVRNVDSNEDYGIFCVFEYGSNGAPSWFKALQLDNWSLEIRLRGDHARYILLSSRGEIEYLSSCPYSYFIGLVSDSYQATNLKNCECQFGEG